MQHDAHVWARHYYLIERYRSLPLPEPEVRRNLRIWMQIQPWHS